MTARIRLLHETMKQNENLFSFYSPPGKLMIIQGFLHVATRAFEATGNPLTVS